MTLKNVQMQRALERIVYRLYSKGEQPTLVKLMGELNKEMAENPHSRPRSFQPVTGRDVGDDHLYNTFLESTEYNVDVLYEVLLHFLRDIVQSHNSLYADLKAMKKRRAKLERRVDDLLLGMRNSEGYFYATSEDFKDIELVNLEQTTCEVDVSAGNVVLPSSASRTKKVDPDTFKRPSINVRLESNDSYNVRELSDLRGATEDSYDNILWAFAVNVPSPQEVVVRVDIPLADEQGDAPEISRLEMVPYGMNDVQVWCLTQPDAGGVFEDFGRRIKTGGSKMTFADTPRRARNLRLFMRKTEDDYTEYSQGSYEYKYVFGARSITLTQKSYERTGRFQSLPHSLPPDMAESKVIDAVSLEVDAETPDDTQIDYYVAALGGAVSDDADFAWQKIKPIGKGAQEDRVARFSGSAAHHRRVREDPEGGDLKAIPERDDGPTAERNPTPDIISGVDIYRIAEFDEAFLKDTMKLLEGVNSTRIYYTERDDDGLSLEFWKSKLETGDFEKAYGRIDSGDNFFYGADVGVGGKSVYVETFLDSPQKRDTFLAQMQKVDSRARGWDLKVYLNGKTLVEMPSGTEKKQVPWAFRKGVNHIILLVQIPESEDDGEDYYMGQLDLMAGRELYDFGDVRLSQWRYVDFFDMKYNQTDHDPPETFTVYEGEIVSRRQPSKEVEVRYSKKSGYEPTGVVVRADLHRHRNTSSVTPTINSYRLRFSYSQDV